MLALREAYTRCAHNIVREGIDTGGRNVLGGGVEIGGIKRRVRAGAGIWYISGNPRIADMMHGGEERGSLSHQKGQ